MSTGDEGGVHWIGGWGHGCSRSGRGAWVQLVEKAACIEPVERGMGSTDAGEGDGFNRRRMGRALIRWSGAWVQTILERGVGTTGSEVGVDGPGGDGLE